MTALNPTGRITAIRMNYNVANKWYEHLMKRALKLVLKLKLNILKTRDK